MARRSKYNRGFVELGNAMRTLKAEVALKMCQKATGRAAGIIKREAIKNAPESDHPHKINGVVVQPGNLKKNIIIKRIKSDLTSEHIVTVRGKAAGGYARRYGRLVEFGTVHMSAQPFLRPAFEANKEKAVEAIRKSLDMQIFKFVKANAK